MTTTKSYDLNVIAFKIGCNESIRTSEAYQMHRGRLIEQTMSCNKREALNWMLHIMMSCINRGNRRRDDGLRAEFLAAYDLHSNISR